MVDVGVSGDSERRVHVFRCDKHHTSIVKLTDQDCTTPPLNLATLRVVVVAVQLFCLDADRGEKERAELASRKHLNGLIFKSAERRKRD